MRKPTGLENQRELSNKPKELETISTVLYHQLGDLPERSRSLKFYGRSILKV